MPDQSSTTTRETVFPVRYAETDAMGVVHHATYLIYFEEGRSQYMRDMGSDYARVEASGYQLPVTETSIRFLGSLRYGDMVRVRTQLEENRSRRVTFSYEILNGKLDDMEFNIPFNLIKSIQPKGRHSSIIELKNGEKLRLEESKDVSNSNDGVLVFMGRKDSEYIEWEDIEEIRIK